MSANSAQSEMDMVGRAIKWLESRLPGEWEVAFRGPAVDRMKGRAGMDATIEVRGPQSFATLVVEARERFEPRDAESLSSGLLRTLRELNRVSVLVVAPWLSPRTRELLDNEGINFLDLTGNARIKLDYPALYLSSEGSSRNPSPADRGTVKLRGRKAGRLIRLLADVTPPYGVGEVAEAAALTQGYVSRLLDALDREALIERSGRGRVETVDVAALLRRWAASYDVLESNDARTFVASEGAADAMLKTTLAAVADRPVVTGSFAAVRLAPVAAPSLLLAYCDDIDATASALGLLPADEGANVVLLKPFDPVVWGATVVDRGVRFAAVSQVAVDCLTGTGRMPAEGEALLGWMEANERSWRQDDVASWARSLWARGRGESA